MVCGADFNCCIDIYIYICGGHKKIGCSCKIDACCRLLPIRRLLSVGFDTAMRVIDV